MLIEIHPETPQKRTVEQIAEGLKRGKVYILPTDTVYALVCLVDQPRSILELYKLKGLDEGKHLSLLCRDVAMASGYATGIPGNVFRFMKNQTPGPYTFILKANRYMDKRGTGKKKTVGIRIVDHPLHRALMEILELPLASTSLTMSEEYYTDPEDLERIYGKRVEGVVNGGIRPHEYSTILDCTDGDFHLLRRGIGSIESIDYVDETEESD